MSEPRKYSTRREQVPQADADQSLRPEPQEQSGIGELRREVAELRRTDELRGSQRPSPVGGRSSDSGRRRASAVRSRRRARRRLVFLLGAGMVVVLLVATLHGVFGSSNSFTVPSNATLAGLSLRDRIVAVANSQVGYSADPSHSYCNKFSAHWDAGAAGCPREERSEEWCADFASWAWQKAGVQFTYGYGAAEINGGSVSLYEWGVANGRWHPATSGYQAAAGDVAIYGLSLGPDPSAAHVAIVTSDQPGQRGPDVINGDGDRTGFSVVETGTNQVRADTGHGDDATLAGYVSPAVA